jgi:membrane associated rhomboid family serine protease
MPAALRLLPTLGPQGPNAPLAPLWTRQFLLFSLVWVGVNVLVGVTGIGFGGESGLIAWQAHLGGFLAGIVLTGPFDRMRPMPIGVSLD